MVQRALPARRRSARDRRDAAAARAQRWTSRRCSASVRTPTLVLHARDDEVMPGRRGAAAGRAAFPAPSSSSSTRAITSCSSTSRRGSGSRRPCSRSCRPDGGRSGRSAFAALSAREREVLALMAEGLSNARDRRAAAASARRRSAITRRTSSTSSASGRAPRRSSSRATAGSAGERRAGASPPRPGQCWLRSLPPGVGCRPDRGGPRRPRDHARRVAGVAGPVTGAPLRLAGRRGDAREPSHGPGRHGTAHLDLRCGPAVARVRRLLRD